jgi:hypothetical protein
VPNKSNNGTSDASGSNQTRRVADAFMPSTNYSPVPSAVTNPTRLPIDEVLDNASIHSTATFPTPSPPEPLGECNEAAYGDSQALDAEEAIEDLPIDVAPEEDELLARNPGTPEGDGYPRPAPPLDFVKRMELEGNRPGKLREAPSIQAASVAFKNISILLRGEAKGTRTRGYKDPQFDPFRRIRLEGIRALLSFYTWRESKTTFEQWGVSALYAARSIGRGPNCARVLAQLARHYIESNGEILPVNPYGSWRISLLDNEDIAQDIRLFLQQLGSEISADKLVAFLRRPDVRQKHGILKDISHSTACAYLKELDYR